MDRALYAHRGRGRDEEERCGAGSGLPAGGRPSRGHAGQQHHLAGQDHAGAPTPAGTDGPQGDRAGHHPERVHADGRSVAARRPSTVVIVRPSCTRSPVTTLAKAPPSRVTHRKPAVADRIGSRRTTTCPGSAAPGPVLLPTARYIRGVRSSAARRPRCQGDVVSPPESSGPATGSADLLTGTPPACSCRPGGGLPTVRCPRPAGRVPPSGR